MGGPRTVSLALNTEGDGASLAVYDAEGMAHVYRLDEEEMDLLLDVLMSDSGVRDFIAAHPVGTARPCMMAFLFGRYAEAERNRRLDRLAADAMAQGLGTPYRGGAA